MSTYKLQSGQQMDGSLYKYIELVESGDAKVDPSTVMRDRLIFRHCLIWYIYLTDVPKQVRGMEMADGGVSTLCGLLSVVDTMSTEETLSYKIVEQNNILQNLLSQVSRNGAAT